MKAKPDDCLSCLEKSICIIRTLQKIGRNFPIQYALCLLEIARDEGISFTTLSSRTGIPISTTSKIISAMCACPSHQGQYDLIRTCISQNERRKKQIHLSDNGRIAVQMIAQAVRIMPNMHNEEKH